MQEVDSKRQSHAYISATLPSSVFYTLLPAIPLMFSLYGREGMKAPRPKRSTSVPDQVNQHQPKRCVCFVPGCEHREGNISSILRHTRSDHAVDYCRGCCDFFEVREAGDIYCPRCYRFCMSPTCVEAILSGTGTARSQVHVRNHACPKVRGTSTGVPSETLLDFMTRLYTERQPQPEALAESAIESKIKSDANGSLALGAEAFQTSVRSQAPSVNLPQYTQAQQSGATDGTNTNSIEANFDQRQAADVDLPLQDGSEPNPEFDWNLPLGDSSTLLDFDCMDFDYDPTFSFQ